MLESTTFHDNRRQNITLSSTRAMRDYKHEDHKAFRKFKYKEYSNKAMLLIDYILIIQTLTSSL